MENPARYLAEIARLRAALRSIAEGTAISYMATAQNALAEGPQITEEEGASGATMRRLTLGDIGVTGLRENPPLVAMPTQSAPDRWHEHEECLRVQADLIADVRELVENLGERVDRVYADMAERIGRVSAHYGSAVADIHERLGAVEAKLAVQIVPDLSEVVAGEMGASGADEARSTFDETGRTDWVSKIAYDRLRRALERIADTGANDPGGYFYRDALEDCVDIAREALGR